MTAEGTDMAGERSTPEQIVAKLRQVEVLTGQGKPVAEAVRAIGVTEQSSGMSCSRPRCSTRFGKRRC